MPKFVNFSANVMNSFDNDEKNYLAFSALMSNASHGIYNDYSAEETNTIIRNQVDRVLGIDSKTASPKDIRQAWRAHGLEACALVENELVDKMVSGWDDKNAFFSQYVEQVNTGAGDKNEFYVEDNSLLQVSKFAGSHHDIEYDSVRVA